MEEGFESRGEALQRLGGDGALNERGRAAARAIQLVGDRLRQEGWRRVGWSDRPMQDQPTHGEWVDHPYALEHQDGRFVYVSEHYGLTPKVVAELVMLMNQGWDVTVGADRTLYLPNHTVAIWVERADPSTLYFHYGEPFTAD